MDNRMGVEGQEEVGSFLQPHQIYPFLWTLSDLIDLPCWIGDYRILTLMELHNPYDAWVQSTIEDATFEKDSHSTG